MAVRQITHSTPATYPRGIRDLGARTVSPTAPAVPTFFPHIYTFAAKGPVGEPFPMVGSTVTSNFGSEVFDDGSDYATHQSVAARLINATGCAQMWQRVIAKDLPANLLAKGYTNASTARLVLWLEVSDQFQVTQYVRTAAGRYTNAAAPVELLDGVGDPIKTTGRAIRWVVTHVDQNGDEITGDVGGLEPITYNYSASSSRWFAAPNKDTTRYPIMEIAARGPGKHYNKCGVRIWPSVYTDNDAPTSAEMRATGGFYYKMAFVRRAKPTTTPLLVSAIDLSTSRFVSLEERTRNDATSAKMSVEDIFSQAYTTSSDPIIYGDIGNVHVYHDNIALIQTQLYNNERDFGLGGSAGGIAAYAN
ncbi:MAG: hypothetical protein ACKO0Z_17420, partial [Betaproteobacteria bacterium]